MARTPDDASDWRRRQASDHIASKHDAFGSDAVQALVKNILIVAGTDADTRLPISLLRASLGRHVNARVAIGWDAVIAGLDVAHPNLVLLRDGPMLGVRPADAIVRMRTAGFQTPVIVIHAQLTARDAVDLRQAGALDVIEVDDLNSVRLFEALLKAVPAPITGTLRMSFLMV